MKGQKWLSYAVLVIVVEFAKVDRASASKAKAKSKQLVQHKTLPFTKSFGMNRPSQGNEDTQYSPELIEQYQEMLKASQESFESFGDQEIRRLRRVVGDNDFGMMADAAAKSYPRRRSAPKFQAQAVKRRVRSQEVRRNKLNIQGRRSHLEHTNNANIDYLDNI